MAVRILSLDSENELIRPGVKAPRLVCVSASLDGQAAELLHHTDAVPFLAEALRAAARTEVRLVGHNFAGFDLPVFAAHEPRLLPLIFAALDADGVHDTKINEQLIDLAKGKLRGQFTEDEDGDVTRVVKGYSLDAITQRRFNRALDKGEDGWRLRYGELRDLPLEQWPERAVRYAKDDAIEAWQVYKAQWFDAKATYPDLLKPAAAEARAAFALGLMTSWGMHTSAERIAELEATYTAKLEYALTIMIEAGLIRRGGTKKEPKWVKDTKALAARVVQALGADAVRTPKGKVSTAAQYLKQTRDPALSACVDYARAQKILTTYVALMREGVANPIQPSFNSVLETGRVSTFNPNLQNISNADGVRECFTPRPGHYFCSVDYNAAELRSWAQVCLKVVGYSRLAETFQRDPNADPHLEFAATRLLGITVEEARARKKAGDEQIKNARQRAKAANFGFPGGMGAERFQATEAKKYWESDGTDGLLISIEDASALREAWFAQWHEAAPYFRWVSSIVGEGTGTFQCFGSGRYRGGCGFSDGANNGFQALTAWGSKAALYEVARACYVTKSSPLYGSRIVNFAHDEIITELPIDRAHEAAAEQTRIMVEAFQRYHPDVPVTAEPALMRCWRKKAEAVYDAAGRLIPWEQPAPKVAEAAPVAANNDVEHPTCILCGVADANVGFGVIPGLVTSGEPHHLGCGLDAYTKRSA